KPVDKGSPERGSLGIGPADSHAFASETRRAIAHIRCSARAHAVWRCMITFVAPHSPWPERSRVARSNQVFFRGVACRRIRGLEASDTDAIGIQPVHSGVDSRGLGAPAVR